MVVCIVMLQKYCIQLFQFVPFSVHKKVKSSDSIMVFYSYVVAPDINYYFTVNHFTEIYHENVCTFDLILFFSFFLWTGCYDEDKQKWRFNKIMEWSSTYTVSSPLSCLFLLTSRRKISEKLTLSDWYMLVWRHCSTNKHPTSRNCKVFYINCQCLE